MGTYEIFLTELVLDNVLTNWQPEEIAAILSSLVCQYRKKEEEKDEEIPKLNEVFIYDTFYILFSERVLN
jgi:superfamily II RNA helicase